MQQSKITDTISLQSIIHNTPKGYVPAFWLDGTACIAYAYVGGDEVRDFLTCARIGRVEDFDLTFDRYHPDPEI